MRTIEKDVKFHDSDEIETQTFGIGEYIEGVNDEEDEDIFFWVDSMDKLYSGADFGDFVII
jgi:hypothetical protein